MTDNFNLRSRVARRLGWESLAVLHGSGASRPFLVGTHADVRNMGGLCNVPAYDTELSEAFLLVHLVNARCPEWTFRMNQRYYPNHRIWVVEVHDIDTVRGTGTDESLPKAICEAFVALPWER